jgi:hypothetical protein
MVKRSATLFMGLFLCSFLVYLIFINVNKKEEKKEGLETYKETEEIIQNLTEKEFFNITFWEFETGLTDVVSKSKIEEIQEKIQETLGEDYLDIEYLPYQGLTQNNELLFYVDCDDELVLQILYSYYTDEIFIGRTNYNRADIEKKLEEQKREEVEKYIENMYP